MHFRSRQDARPPGQCMTGSPEGCPGWLLLKSQIPAPHSTRGRLKGVNGFVPILKDIQVHVKTQGFDYPGDWIRRIEQFQMPGLR